MLLLTFPRPPLLFISSPFVSNSKLHEEASALVGGLPASLACSADASAPGAVRHVYLTSVGGGPRTLGPADALAGADGQPLVLAGAADGEFDKGL
jgi:hypothetical protein